MSNVSYSYFCSRRYALLLKTLIPKPILGALIACTDCRPQGFLGFGGNRQ